MLSGVTLRNYFALAAFSTLLLSCGAAPQPAAKPNVLFIAVDDLNDWVGPLRGHPQIQTPNMDRLAERGVVFANTHAQAPLCNPSRTSLMTGLRPSTTGGYGLAPWFREVEALSGLVTLPQHFEQNGYTTYSTGKIYHGGYGRREGDTEFQHLGPAASVGALPEKKLVNTPSNHPLMDWGVFPHKDEDKGDWKVASWAAEQLQGDIQEPFFLSAGFFLPHVPLYVTQKWIDMYPEETVQLPPMLREDRDDTPRFSWYLHWKLPEPRLRFLEEENEWKNIVRSYLAATSFMDSQVGRILDALEASGHADDTIVVLWSDHGYHLGEKLISGKNTLWDRSTHVPLIFSGPGIVGGTRVNSPAELLDMYPTLVELVGLPQRDGLEGHSLVPQLRDPAAPREWPAITTHNHDNHGVRSSRWRYIRYADGSEELYDMEADPNEWRNLAGETEYADVVSEHKRWLPEKSAPPAPGSAARILTYENGGATWEGEVIGDDDPIPEI
ncbi:MAG: sulfatase [Acidobacteria bacterium]|nr:sulfatase [Acidobacteriota bacterium]